MHRNRAKRTICLAVIFMLMLGLTPMQTFAASEPVQKLLVSGEDVEANQSLAKSGAVLVEKYGAFSLWEATSTQAKNVLGRSGVAAHDDFNTIEFRDSAFDTRAGVDSVPASLSTSRIEGSQLWLVQFVGPVRSEWLTKLEANGVKPVIYMPNNAYVVWADSNGLALLDGENSRDFGIQWNGAYHTAYRLAPQLKNLTPSKREMVNVTVQFYTTDTTKLSYNNLLALGGNVWKEAEQILGFTNVSLQVPASQLEAIAKWNDVFNVETWTAPRLLDEAQGQIMSGNVTTSGGNVVPTGPNYLAWLSSKGFPTTPASYPLVDVVDDGIDTGSATPVHADFFEFGLKTNPDRLVYNSNCTTDATGNAVGGHGNLNAGIVGGYNNTTGAPYEDANGYQRNLGISPYGRLGGTKIFANAGAYNVSACGNTDAGVVANSYNKGATFTSNSWGADNAGGYDSSSQAYDLLTRDASSSTTGNQQMLHIFAAGNAGSAAKTVGSPGTAKNVLTVGATENVRDQGVVDGCSTSTANNADDMATFSSRGPTADARIKPDISAPGTHVQGPASQDPAYNGTGVCDKYYPAGQTLYAWSSGTSHSTPGTSGAASLAYNYYNRVLVPGQNPSPAMLKGLLVNSPRYMNGVGSGGNLPSNSQGWGDVNLGMLTDGAPRFFSDQANLLTATGQTSVKTGKVSDSTKPLRVSLVWTDAPGSTTGNSYVNNLDLEVTIGGVVYKGNVFTGANSTAGGTADVRNNVENVFLPAGTTGSFSVKVTGTNIAGNGVPGNASNLDQDFALIIYNYADDGGVVNPPTGNNLLTNGDFEAGATAWTGTGVVDTTRPHAGTKSVNFCNVANCSQSLYQDVAIPANVTTASLSFWTYITTQETTHSYDFLKAEARNTAGTVLATLATLSDGSPVNTWAQSTVDVSAYKGQTLRVQFSVTNDSTLPTNFFVDDVVLSTSGTGGGSTPTELVANGGLESTTSWTGTTTAINTTRPHAGTKSANFCNTNSCNQSLYQAITIPANATTVTLTYWTYITTKETSHSYDYLRVQVRSTAGTVLSTVQTLSDGSPTGSWVKSTYDLSAYKGQTVQINFAATTDSSNTSNFFVDDVSVISQ